MPERAARVLGSDFPGWSAGRVTLVGAGPGAPDLITVRALSRLRQAQVVVFDRLVHRALVDEASAEAERVDAGKRPGGRGAEQGWIENILVDRARRGLEVVRLKGGDPYLFGRGSEEADACHAAGIRCEVIPGVSSALAAPAAAGVPVTERGVAASFAVVTGHRARHFAPVDWQGLTGAETLVVLMGLGNLDQIARSVIASGRPASTPTAVIERGTLPDQRVVRGPLVEIAERVARAGLQSPATVVIGEVARHRDPAAEVRLAGGEPESLSSLSLEPPFGDSIPTVARRG